MRRREYRRTAVVLWLFGLLTGGCSSDAGLPGDLPADAFPNRRPEYYSEGRLLGYVANKSSDTISVLDLDTMTSLGEAPVGRIPVDIDGPRHVILDPTADLAYVALSYPMDVVGPHQAASGATQRAGYVMVLALPDLRALGELRVDPKSDDISLSADGQQLVVSHNDALRAIRPGDLEDRRANLTLIGSPASIITGTSEVRRLKLCVAPAAVSFGPDGRRAYVACTGEDTVAVVDTQTASVLSRVPAGPGATNKPIALVVDASGESLLVSNQISRTLVSFSADDTPVLKWSLSLTGIPIVAAWLAGDGEDRIVVPLQDPSGAALVSAVDGTVLRQVDYSDDACPRPSEAKPYADGRLFFVCENDQYMPGSVVQVDPETLEIKAGVQVGAYPDRLALRPPG